MLNMEFLAIVHPTAQSDIFKNDILPIELSNSKLKGYQRVQLSWAKDGTIVQRLGKKKLFGRNYWSAIQVSTILP